MFSLKDSDSMSWETRVKEENDSNSSSDLIYQLLREISMLFPCISISSVVNIKPVCHVISHESFTTLRRFQKRGLKLPSFPSISDKNIRSISYLLILFREVYYNCGKIVFSLSLIFSISVYPF